MFGTGVEIDTTARPGVRRLVHVGRRSAADRASTASPSRCATGTPPLFADHPLGARSIDHVVIATDSLSRTSAAIADATGAAVKRVREAGEIRQGFHRLGGLIVEVVERTVWPPGRRALGSGARRRRPRFGVRPLGAELVDEPRDAVQPGRRIATLAVRRRPRRPGRADDAGPALSRVQSSRLSSAAIHA